MAFPTNPTNGQQASVNGVVYTWSSTKGVWQVTTTFTGNILVNQINANAVVSAGNVSGTNFSGAIVSMTGNVTGGNLLTAGSISATGAITSAGTLTATTIVESSSIALKENIRPIGNSLESLTQLVGVLYDRKNNSARNEPGLIAESVDAVIPELVARDQQGKPFGIHYSKLSVYLLEAIKTLSNEINDLKKRH